MCLLELLLVDRRSGQGHIARFVEQVHTIFSGFFRVLLRVQGHSWRVVLDIGWQDDFGPVDEEERGVAGGPVGSFTKTPDDDWQLVESAAGCSLQGLDQPGLDAG